MIDDEQPPTEGPLGAPAPGRRARVEPTIAEAAGSEPSFPGSAAADEVRDEAPSDSLAARDAERLLAQRAPSPGAAAHGRFVLLVALALLLHAAIIAAFLYRDRHASIEVARSEEVPVEVVVEPPKPPEPSKPPEPPPRPKPPEPPKPPDPPKPKEDLSPALSAPRAPNEDKLKTERLQEKTAVPKAPQPPSEGQPQPKVAAAPPKEAAPEPLKEEKQEAAKEEEDRSKPDAEALDKARPKPKVGQPKAAKAAPKQKKAPDLMASLAGLSATPDVSFAKPTPKSKVYGGTEDVRWMSTVEGMLEAKVVQLPHTGRFQEGGMVQICFHVDVSGRVTVKEYCRKSGYPEVDALAMRALMAAAPFPPPPPGIERGLVWQSVFDGQLPHVHVSKQ